MKKKRIQLKHWLVLPAIIIMLSVMIFPLLFSLRTSFYYYIISKPTYRPFIWFANYLNMLKDGQVLNSIVVTLKIAIRAVIIEFIVGFIIAHFLSKIPRYQNFLLSVLIMPMMLSSIAVGMMWRLLLNPDLGIVNYLLTQIGIKAYPWLALPKTALPTIVFVEVWRSTPFVALMLDSVIISLPVEPFESATIDGANAWQKFYYLTLPLLQPIILVLVTIRAINLIKLYDLIFIMTHGGPGDTTETISHYIWRVGFTDLDLGKASAGSWIIVIFISILTTFLFNRLFKIGSKTQKTKG